MIRLIDAGALPPAPEPLIGCRIETLAACYGDRRDSSGPDFYQSGEGGLLCRFGDTLLLSGRCAVRELQPFARMLGIRRIEARGTLLSSLRGTRRHHTVLAAVPDQTENLPPPAAAPEAMRRVFSLLCESDPAFATEATYLLWLSDLTRRKNCGRAQVYLLDDDATACLSAVSPRYAYLSMVAVAPGARRAGLGSRLLRAVLADCAARSLIVLTAAQDDALLPFYRSAGFDVQPDPLVSLTLFPSHHHKESDR